MPDTIPQYKPVEDSVPKVDNAVAVGEDLEFQRKWWRFERGVWIFFAFVILADVAGVFGRGPVAKAQRHNDALTLHYERIERTGTPSTMSFQFAPGAIHNGQVQLFVSQSVVKELGNQRVSPQPEHSTLTDGGITYTFPATSNNAPVEFSLEPSLPGIYHFTTGIPGTEPIQARVVVMP